MAAYWVEIGIGVGKYIIYEPDVSKHVSVANSTKATREFLTKFEFPYCQFKLGDYFVYLDDEFAHDFIGFFRLMFDGHIVFDSKFYELDLRRDASVVDHNIIRLGPVKDLWAINHFNVHRVLLKSGYLQP